MSLEGSVLVVTVLSRVVVVVVLSGAGIACGDESDSVGTTERTGAVEPSPRSPMPTPSDDPADWDEVASGSYAHQPMLSEPRWLIPSEALPVEIEALASNNNVDINLHAGRLFVAWRTAPTHFADVDSRMVVISSGDQGVSWEAETTVALGADVREPRLLDFQGRLQMLFFEAGTNPVAFEPQRILRVVRDGPGGWSQPEVVFDRPEVPWDVKVRAGRAWMTSYIGDHYDKSRPDASVDVRFLVSDDGDTWEPVDGVEAVYTGGVSEAAFEFDSAGDLWAVTRNEDGDASGYGSHVCYAEAGALGSWDCPAEASVHRYDSPEMFRFGETIYLLARRDPDGPFGPQGDLIAYSLRKKTTALYKIEQQTRSVVHIEDLPGCGDTAFPAVRRTGADSFVVANYTSPLDSPDIPWLEGQLSERGTQIYLLDLSFRALTEEGR